MIVIAIAFIDRVKKRILLYTLAKHTNIPLLSRLLFYILPNKTIINKPTRYQWRH